MTNWETFIFIQKNYPWFFQALVFVFGACMGSFFNVCIYRIPKKESIMRPPSHNARGDALAWFDNIPLVSWCILRGRDRTTGERFSVRYLIVEWLTALLFLTCWIMLPWQQAFAGFVLISLLVPAAFIDLDHMILPDFFTVGGAVIGFVVSVSLPELHVKNGVFGFFPDMVRSGAVSMLGILLGSAIVLWILVLGEWLLKKPVMGEGDIFFAGCIGAFCGWQGALFCVFGGSLIGMCILLPLMLMERLFKVRLMKTETAESLKNESDESGDKADVPIGIGVAVPFGPWMALGALVYFLGTRDFVDSYLNTIVTLFFSDGR